MRTYFEARRRNDGTTQVDRLSADGPGGILGVLRQHPVSRFSFWCCRVYIKRVQHLFLCFSLPFRLVPVQSVHFLFSEAS